VDTPLSRILVIEDEPAHSEAIARALEDIPGLEIRVVPSLGAFREAEAAFQPQLALMDLHLPDGQATEALAGPRAYPIIVMTSYGSEQAAVEVLKSGAYDYLIKSPETFRMLPRTLDRLHREWQAILDGQRAEAALRETHRFNDQIIRCAQEGIVVYGPDLRYQVWNPFMERFTGIPADQALGRHPTELFPFLEAAGVMDRLARVLAGETVETVDFSFMVPGTGAAGWASDSCAALHNAAGGIIGVIATVRDITEKKKLEQTQLFLARADWLASGTDIFTAMATFLAIHLGVDYVCIDRLTGDLLSAQTLAIWFDGRFEDNVAYTLRDTPCGELVGKRICCFPEGVRHRFPRDQVLQDMLAESYLGTTLFGTDGRPIGLIALIGRRPIANLRVAEDTLAQVAQRAAGELERREAEEVARQREAQFRTYIEKAPFGVFIADSQGRYLEVNPEASRITGFSREELLAMAIPDLLPESARAEGGLCFQTLLDTGYTSCELDFLRKDGQVGRWTVEAVALAADRYLGFAQDITARRQAEFERTRLQEHLQQVQKLDSLGSLASGLAHDMNNVLGAILSLASAHLTLQPEGSPVHRAFATIAEAATRGGKMVKSLLTFARQQPAEQRTLDLNTLLTQNLSLLEHTTLAKVRLVTAFVPDLAPVMGDPNALVSVFMNLCVNAVDAMPRDGTLTLRTRNAPGGLVEVEVEDNGEGMAPAVLARAMDPFFTTKATGKGTGLGLSMAYSTVKAHRGTLEIRSAPGQGTCVRLRFPACPGGAPADLAALPARTGAGRGGLRLLLVDDDELVTKSTQMMIEVLGHSIVTAASAEEALEALQGGLVPDAVILDMNMPGMGGAGLLPALRALCPAAPVLLATGRVDETALRLVETHPGMALMAKPFSMGDLQAHLGRIARTGRP